MSLWAEFKGTAAIKAPGCAAASVPHDVLLLGAIGVLYLHFKHTGGIRHFEDDYIISGQVKSAFIHAALFIKELEKSFHSTHREN